MSIIKNMFGVTTSSEDADYAQIKPEGAQKDIKLPDYLDGSKYNPEKGFFQEYLLFDNLSATGRKMDTDDFEEYQDIARVGTKILQSPARIVTDVAQDILQYSSETGSDEAQARSEAIDKAYRDASGFVSENLFGLPASAVVDDKGTPRRTTTGKGLTLDMAAMVYTGLKIYRGTEALSLVKNPNKTMKKVNKALRALAAGQLTAQLLMDSEENNAQIIADLGLKNTRVGPVLEYLSADEDDPRLLKRAKLATTELITELTFAGTLRMFGVFGKSATEFSRKTFNKEIEELNEVEQDEFLPMVLTNTQRANQKRPSPAVQVVREANEDSAEGIKQIFNQQTNNKTWLGKSASMLYKYKQRYFTSRGFLTEQGYNAKQKALWSTRETVGHAEALAKRLESRIINFEAYHGVEGGDIGNFVADALQADLRKIPKNRRARILQQQYNLPPDIAYDVLEARTMIDKLSQEWIDSGIGNEGLRAAMAENLSSYLRRSYRAFDEKGYVPTDKNRQDAIDFIEELHIKERYTAADIEDGLTDEELAAANRFAELKVDKILKETEGKNYGETVQNLMRINSNLLKGRKEVPREIRRLLGEYESTPINILQTVTKLSNMVETNRYFKTLEELGGSTPADKVLYVRANRKARREIESMNVDELQRDFDVTLPQNENVTAGGKAGVFKRINSEGEYIVEFKDSKTGELAEETFASSDIRLIPRDAVLDKLTKKYYKEEGGVFTESKYIFADTDNPPKGYAEIEGTGSSLDGKYTSPEMKIAIENLEATFGMSSRIRNSKIVQGWRSIKGVTQQMKTVWDHTTQLRNNFGGLNFSARNGIYTLENSKTAMKVLANTMSDMPAKQWDFVYNRLRGLGVVNTQAQAGEWQALLTGADDLTPQQWTDRIEKFVLNLDQKVDNTLERIGGTVNDVDPDNPWLSGSVGGEKRINSNPLNLPQKFYMAVDDFYKINGFAEELKVLSKAYPDKPYNELLDEAAEIVRNTFPNYDMIPNGLKAIRDLPLGNFVAFTPEIIRTETKILAQTLKELSSSNPVIKQRGMKRLSGGLVVHGGWMAAGTFAASATGITDVQEGALQTLSESPWSKKHNKIFFRVGSDFYYSDPTYLNPYDVFPSVYKTWQAEMMNKDFKGIDTDKWEKNIFDAASASMLDSVAFATDPALGAKYAFDLADAFYSQNGYTKDGKQVFKNHRDSEGNIVSWDNVILGMVDFSMETVAPGFVADATDLRDAMNETPNPRTGFVRDARLKLIEFFTGFNLKKIDIEYLLTMKGKQFSSRSGYRVDKADKPEFFKDNPDVPFANWFNSIAKEQAERFSTEQDFYRQLVAFQDLGVIENDIKDILKENVNISFDTTDDLLDNRFVPRRPSVATMKEAKERFGKDHEGFYYLEKWFQGIENLRLTPTDPSLQLPEQEYTRDQINQLREGRKIGIFNNNFPKVKDIINKRGYYARGGEVEVLNVPNVPVRPDNRLDKLTGRTYLEQARDPLRRLGFLGGGSVNVDPLKRLGFANGTEVQAVNSQEKSLPPDLEFQLSANAIKDVVMSDRDLESEVNELKAKSTEDDDTPWFLKNHPWAGGLRHFTVARRNIQKDLKENKITDFEGKLRTAGVAADAFFAPIGDLLSYPVGVIADQFKKEYNRMPEEDKKVIEKKVTDTTQEVNQWLDENPQFKRQAKNVNAVVSLAGFIPATRIMTTGANNIAANVDLLLREFYKKGATEGDKAKVTMAYATQAVPKTILDTMLPVEIAKSRGTIPLRKREEIKTFEHTADAVAGIIQAKNIREQLPKGKNKPSDLLTNGAIYKSYAYEQLSMVDKASVKAAMFENYVDFDIPEAIKDRMLNHLYFGPYQTGKGVIGSNIAGAVGEGLNVPKLLKPIDPKNTTIDVKNPTGIQNQILEAHGGTKYGPSLLNKLFEKKARDKLAYIISQLNPDGTLKSSKTPSNKKIKAGSKDIEKTFENLGVLESDAKYVLDNEDIFRQLNTDDVIAKATPEQIKEALKIPWGNKDAARGIDFKVDEKNPNIIYFQDTYLSKSKESGGVNAMIAIDLDTKDVYTMISDKHDMLLNLKPFGRTASDRLTVTVPTKRNYADINQKGGHTPRNYQAEAQASLDQLDNYGLKIQEDNVLSVPTYDRITGRIPTGVKKKPISRGKNINISLLETIANAKSIEKVGGVYKVDGKRMSKADLNSGVDVNASIIEHFAGKATASDWGVFTRRLGEIILVTGESATVEEEKQSRVLDSLKKKTRQEMQGVQ